MALSFAGLLRLMIATGPCSEYSTFLDPCISSSSRICGHDQAVDGNDAGRSDQNGIDIEFRDQVTKVGSQVAQVDIGFYESFLVAWRGTTYAIEYPRRFQAR